MIEIYTASQIAAITGFKRDHIHKLYKRGEIPAPAYIMNGMYGWTAEQVEGIKESLSKKREFNPVLHGLKIRDISGEE